MPETSFSVRIHVETQKAREELERVISSVEGFHLQESQNPLPCDLLILEIGDDPKKEFQLVHNIQDAGMAREVFLTSPCFEPDLLIQVLRAGVKEFFPQPIKEEEVKNALSKFKERKESLKISVEAEKKNGKIIDVVGCKGGVGTTTIAVNLAASLIELEGSPSPSVALIDMNFLFGEISAFLNIEPAFSWGEVAKNISRLDSTYLMGILSKHSSGVYVLSSPPGLDGANVTTPEIIEKLLIEMQDLFDFIVIDSGQSIGDISLKILEMSNTVLLVAILSLPCLTNVKRLLWAFRELGYPQEESIKVVISRYHKKSLISLKEAEQSIKKKIFWVVPNDFSTTMSAINEGKTLLSVAHGTEIGKSFRNSASIFLGKSVR